MKSIVRASVLALFLLGLVTAQSAAAQTNGGSAKGSYKFVADDGLVKYVEFESSSDDKGVTTGGMLFEGQAHISDRDVEEGEETERGGEPSDFYMKAEFDAMTVEKNRAVMSGVVRDSSHPNYVGRWVQLVVEDAGDRGDAPDTLTWGFCRPEQGGWIPTDAERKYDDGAFMRWWATDAERKDDVGIPSKNLIPGETKGCQVYSLSSYTFLEIKRWDGDILVQP